MHARPDRAVLMPAASARRALLRYGFLFEQMVRGMTIPAFTSVVQIGEMLSKEYRALVQLGSDGITLAGDHRRPAARGAGARA